jgi:hypothetical protein
MHIFCPVGICCGFDWISLLPEWIQYQLTQTYFHVAPVNLAVDSVIHPGNWGRIIKSCYAAPNANHILLPYRESVFEYARLALAPEKIGRLTCLFACLSFDEAQKYRNTHAQSNIIYEIQPVGDTTGFHIANYDLIMLPQSGQYFEVFDRARRYWTDADPPNKEILLPCPAKIVSLPEGPHGP